MVVFGSGNFFVKKYIEKRDCFDEIKVSLQSDFENVTIIYNIC